MNGFFLPGSLNTWLMQRWGQLRVGLGLAIGLGLAVTCNWPGVILWAGPDFRPDQCFSHFTFTGPCAGSGL